MPFQWGEWNGPRPITSFAQFTYSLYCVMCVPPLSSYLSFTFSRPSEQQSVFPYLDI